MKPKFKVGDYILAAVGTAKITYIINHDYGLIFNDEIGTVHINVRAIDSTCTLDVDRTLNEQYKQDLADLLCGE
jgi:hypothetical protein